MAADYLRGGIAAAFAKVLNLRGELPRSRQVTAERMMDELTVEGEQERARPVQRRCEFPCPGINLAQLRHCPASACDRYLTEADLQIELDFPAPVAVGQAGNPPQPAAKKAPRLPRSPSAPRPAARR